MIAWKRYYQQGFKHDLPIQTSPKQPCPSLRSRRRDSLGISQASLDNPWVWGFRTGQMSVRLWHRPSACSDNGERRGRIKRLPSSCAHVWKSRTHCGSDWRGAARCWTACARWCRSRRCPASWSCSASRSALWCCHSPTQTDSRHLQTSATHEGEKYQVPR